MRAARFHGRGDVRIDDVPAPELRPGTVAIDVAWCGICGTDLHEYQEGPIFIPPPGSPQPVSGESAPVVLGHEFSGTVSALGEGVDDLSVGDAVVVEPYIIRDDVDTSPGQPYQLSPDMNFIGLGGRGGGLSEKIVVQRRWVHPVGDVPLDQAALIEPLAVGHHAFVRSGAAAGDVALVGGAGPIGLLLSALLTAEGLTVCFECTSVNAVLDTLIDAVRPGGVVVNVSIWGHPAQVDMQKLVLKEIDLRGTIAYAGDHPATIELVRAGKVDLTPFITARIPLEDLVSDGFETLIHHNDTQVKILVHP